MVGDLDYSVAGGRDGAKAKAPKFQAHDDDSMWIFSSNLNQSHALMLWLHGSNDPA